MRNLIFQEANSIEEALQLIENVGEEIRTIAGGTDLAVELRSESNEEGKALKVMDISRIKGLKGIDMDGEIIRIGALTTHTEIEESSIILKYAPVLAKACSQVGGPQIRNRGTLGGNIVNASPAADSVPALVALNAILLLKNSTGTREVSISDFIAGPYMTVIAADELLISISFRRMQVDTEYVFVKVGRRKALSISRMNLALMGHKDEEGKVDDIRFAAGSVMPKPRRIREIEEIFLGKVPNEDLFLQAQAIIQDVMVKESGIRKSTTYKKPVIGELTYSALRECF